MKRPLTPRRRDVLFAVAYGMDHGWHLAAPCTNPTSARYGGAVIDFERLR